jgi:hypothetical protein
MIAVQALEKHSVDQEKEIAQLNFCAGASRILSILGLCYVCWSSDPPPKFNRHGARRKALKLPRSVPGAEFGGRLLKEYQRSVLRLCSSPDLEAVRGGGTGLLFRISGEHFLITAKHVLDNFLPQEILAFIPDRQAAVTLGGKVLDLGEPHDIAIIHLNPLSMKRLCTADFRTQQDLDTAALNPADQYFLYGYPIDPNFCNPSRTAWKAEPLVCELRLTTAPSFLTNYSDDANDVFEIDLNRVTDNHGESTRLPANLNGVSGGPIFRLTRSGHVSIIGVETSEHRESNRGWIRWIKTTRWSYVLGAIENELGGIRAATRLLLPLQRV